MKKRMIIVMVLIAMLVINYSFAEKDYKVMVEDGTLYGTMNHRTYDKLVVFISGSGPTDRDGNSDLIGGRNDSIKELVSVLNKAEISTFAYDKRTSGRSASTFNLDDVSFDDFINDGNAILSEMKSLAYESIYLIGHSQGALIVEIIGQDSQVEGVISLCGTVESIDSVLNEQFKQYDADTYAQATAIIEKISNGEYDFIVPESLQFFFGENDRFLHSWIVHNPMSYIQPIATKMLFIYGDRDVQVSHNEIDKLDDIYPYFVIEDMNHVLKHVGSDHENTDSYINPIYKVSPELIDVILDFIN